MATTATEEVVRVLEGIVRERLDQPHFVKYEGFIENGFSQRCLGKIMDSWLGQESRVIAAIPFSGKSRVLTHLIRESAAYKDEATGETRVPLIGVVTPKARTEAALGNKIASAIGTLVNMTWVQRRGWLFEELIRVKNELLVIDDAQDLSIEQLRYLKEIYDTLLLKEHRLTMCYLSASDGHTVPLQETLESGTLVLRRQFERRLDIEDRYCQIDNHTKEEVAQILDAYERAYRPQFAHLTLLPYARSIYDWLIDPRVDIEGTRRVTMGNIEAFVIACLKRAFMQSLTNVTEDIVFDVAQLMALRRNELINVAGDGDAHPATEIKRGA